jgi:hypothetical protein
MVFPEMLGIATVSEYLAHDVEIVTAPAGALTFAEPPLPND